MRLSLIALVVMGFAPGRVQAQVAGYFEGPVVPLPDSLREYSGDIAIRVTRRWSDEFEQELLVRAERLYPPATDIESAAAEFLARHDSPAGWIQHFREAERLAGERWRWHDFGWARLPYALTGAAVDHLVTQMRAFRTAAVAPHGAVLSNMELLLTRVP